LHDNSKSVVFRSHFANCLILIVGRHTVSGSAVDNSWSKASL